MFGQEVAFGRRGGAALAAFVLTITLTALLAPAFASAATYVVDTTADEADAAPGGECATAANKCSLRAAIEVANASGATADEIDFDGAVFEGLLADTVTLTTPLPAIVDAVSVDGGQCQTGLTDAMPCAGVSGLAEDPGLVVEADDVTVADLAITDAEIAIVVEGADGFLGTGNWIGIDLGGDAGANEYGIQIGPDSNGATIGGEGEATRNVISNTEFRGLWIYGSDDTVVTGNYFGVDPVSGDVAAPNGTNIQISDTQNGFQSSDSEIGGRVSGSALASPQCDGPCNVVAGQLHSGINLHNGVVADGPLGPTTIRGNHIGINASGTAALAAAAANGISALKSGGVTVGGPDAGDSNAIAGGKIGTYVYYGPDQAIEGNRIGFTPGSNPTPLLPPTEFGIQVSRDASSGSVVAGNSIGMDGGVGIRSDYGGSVIAGNEVTGAEVGIQLWRGNDNRVEDNLVDSSEAEGIVFDGARNEFFGNEVIDAGAAGIALQQSETGEYSENVIGGDSAASENLISGSGGAAIEFKAPASSENEAARNRGAGNAGMFIDLVPIDSGGQPNHGIAPPVITAVETSGASGTSTPGATVRVFNKATTADGEINSFLAETTADGAGNWKATYASLPPAAIVAVTQTTAATGTSELETAFLSMPFPCCNGRGPGYFGTDEPDAPETKILEAPRKRSHKRTARFEFRSDDADARFECQLDGRKWKRCASPKVYAGLAPGRHVFRVRAVVGKQYDHLPSVRRFVVLR